MADGIKFYNHPEYNRNVDQWDLLRKLYEGQHSVITNDPTIFWRHYQESKGTVGPELLKERKLRSRYLNIPGLVLSIWVSFFFRKSPNVSEDATELLGDSFKDVDGEKTSFITFMSKSLTHYLLYGKIITLVERIGDGKIFFQLINPLDLKDWSRESVDSKRIGLLNFARINSTKIKPRGRASQKPTSYYAADEFYIDEGTGKYIRIEYKTEDPPEIPEGDRVWEQVGEARISEVTEIPIVIVEDKSWLEGVAQETLRHFNLRSSKDSIEQAQCYQKNFITGLDSSQTQQIAAVTEHVYPLLPVDANVITVPPVDTSSLKESIAEALDSAFKMGLNQLRQVASGSKQVQASESISEERDERIAMVQSTMEELENYGNKLLHHFAIFMGKESDGKDFQVKFDKKITGDDINSFIAVYNSFRDILLKYPEAEKAIAMRVSDHLFDMEDNKAIKKQINDTFLQVSESNSSTQSAANSLFNINAEGEDGS